MFIDTSTGQLGLGPMISSERYKQDILPMGASSEGVLQLRPVTFSYKQDAQRTNPRSGKSACARCLGVVVGSRPGQDRLHTVEQILGD